jgi:uncharacterized protein (UPF0248 family)
MVYPREVLNRLKWTDGESLDEAVVWYVHRGAPGDLMSISGSEIISLGPGFFEKADASIPYHRIVRIEYRGETIFEKPRQVRATSLDAQ